MKKIRLWVSGFSLVQQFIGVAFLTVVFFIVFASGTFSGIVDTYVNSQMYSYLNTSSNEYISNVEYKDENTSFYFYDENKNILIPEDRIFDSIDISVFSQNKNYTFNNAGDVYSCVVTPFNETKSLIAVSNPVYRNEVKSNIMSVVLNTSLIFVAAIFFLFLLWIMSLILPLNQIKNYIEKIRKGEDADLKMLRHDEIGEVATALSDMHAELEKQSAIKEEMIQNISHDLKTPIATIKSYSESIKDGVYPYGTLEKSVDVILEHADRLEKKVYALLTLNRVGYLVDSSEGKTVDMNDVIKKAILSCEVLRNDISINTYLDDGVLFHGEEEPWRVVVENLLDNALRYAKTKVEITLVEDILEVYNDGELMEKERIEKLFKPYEKGTKGKFGLGLSIVKRVTETYGYQVTGENKTDGVVFRIVKIYKNKKRKQTKNSENDILGKKSKKTKEI